MENKRYKRSCWSYLGGIGYREHEAVMDKLEVIEEAFGELKAIAEHNRAAQEAISNELAELRQCAAEQVQFEQQIYMQIEDIENDVAKLSTLVLAAASSEAEESNVQQKQLKSLKAKTDKLNDYMKQLANKEELAVVEGLLRVLAVNSLLDAEIELQ